MIPNFSKRFFSSTVFSIVLPIVTRPRVNTIGAKRTLLYRWQKTPVTPKALTPLRPITDDGAKLPRWLAIEESKDPKTQMF